MQAVIFAAGKSTRTYPLTLTKPKPMLKIANRAILERNLTQLQGIVEEVIIIVGYKAEMIEKYGNKFGNLKIKYVTQHDQNGTGGALLAAKDLLKEKFLVMNGDDLFSREDIKKCIRHDYCVLGKEVEDLSRFGELIIEKNIITEIKEKPHKKKGIANTGLYVFSFDIFNHKLRKSIRGEYEITDFVKATNNFKLEIVEDYWYAITYPWNLLDANEFFMKKVKPLHLGKIEKNVTLKGAVFVGKNTIVKSGSYIEGPVIIGENCVIGPNCYIRANTVVGNNSKIGNAVEVKNSLIGNHTNIGHLSYVGDSVIGDNVNFGAGTIVANLRHDNKNIKSSVKHKLVDTGRRKLGVIIGDNVKLGIKTTIYPGRKIWPDKHTLPLEIVKKDVM